MTSRTRSQIYVSIAAMILTAALGVPAAARGQISRPDASREPSRDGRHDTLPPGATV